MQSDSPNNYQWRTSQFKLFKLHRFHVRVVFLDWINLIILTQKLKLKIKHIFFLDKLTYNIHIPNMKAFQDAYRPLVPIMHPSIATRYQHQGVLK